MANVPVLENPNLALLLDTAQNHTPSADRSKPWLVPTEKDNEIIIKEDPFKVGGFSDQRGFLTSLAFGCFADVILKQAEFMGLPLELTSELMAQEDKAPTIRIKYDLSGLNNVAKMQVAPGIANRYTERSTKFTEPKTEPNYIELAANVEKLGCRLDVFKKNDGTRLKELAKLAALAEEMRFQDPNIHAELVAAVDWDNSGRGIPIESMKLSMLQKFAFKHIIRHWPRVNILNKFGLFKSLGAEIAGNPIKNSPVTLCFSSESYEKEHLYNCGRALYRTWFDLTEQGLVVHPYAAIGTMSSGHFNFENEQLEQKRLNFSSKLGTFLNNDAANAPCILLRVGQL